MKRSLVSLSALLVLLSLATSAQAVPVTFARSQLNVDWTSAGVGGFGPSPATISLSGVTGTISAAYLYWHGINNTGGTYQQSAVTLNSTPVAGTALGDASTNCWGAGSSRAFVADVTSLVSGDGSYTIDNVIANAGDSANGASLVVVFDDGNPANNRDLVFFEGNDSNYPEGFPGEDTGWHATLGGINHVGGVVRAQIHLADGQAFPDDSLTFTSTGGDVVVADSDALYDGFSVPNAGNGRDGALWDIHTFDITTAFGAPGAATLSVNGMGSASDCLGLTLMLLEVDAGSISCGNGQADPGEQCDPAGTGDADCIAPSTCTATCVCGCESDAQCDDSDPCTPDICNRASGTCDHSGDLCVTTTTMPPTTTIPPPPTGACCYVSGGCEDLPEFACIEGGNSFQGFGSSCTDPGICLPVTTTTFPPTTTTLPITGACCQAGDCFVGTAGQCDGGQYQGDGTTCDIGTCANCGNGLVESGEECDDANTASEDGCDGACAEEPCWTCTEPVVGTTSTTILVTGPALGGSGPSNCEPDDGQSCDDGDECTVSDGCSAGACTGEEVLIPAACKWAVVGGDPSKDVRARTRAHAEVVGRICGDEIFIGEEAESNEIVGMRTTGNAIRISRAPVIAGDVVTDGGGVLGKPNGVPLPGLATDTVAGGAVVFKDMTSNYDTTGNHALTDECNDAQADIDVAVPLLDGLPPTADLGNVQIGGQGSLTIAPGSPAGVTAGGVNVIDIGRFRTGNNVTVTLDGGGNPDTVYILRVNKKFDLHFQGDLVLTNGQSAANVIIYGRSTCKFGEETTGGGTVICPEGKLFLEERATWNGALLGGKQRIEVRDSAILTHVPLQVGN